MSFQALTSSELNSNLVVVEANLEARQTAATTEISNYEEILEKYVSAAETKLATDMTTASQPYSTKINQFIVQAAEEGKLIVKSPIHQLSPNFYRKRHYKMCVCQ